jgi:hypothetical protein
MYFSQLSRGTGKKKYTFSDGRFSGVDMGRYPDVSQFLQ